MPRSEAQKRARNAYTEKCTYFAMYIYPTEQDILEKLKERTENGEPKATYIKRLIREDIERSKKTGE